MLLITRPVFRRLRRQPAAVEPGCRGRRHHRWYRSATVDAAAGATMAGRWAARLATVADGTGVERHPVGAEGRQRVAGERPCQQSCHESHGRHHRKELAASAIERALNLSIAKELSQRVIRRATDEDKATTAGVSRGLAYNVVNNAGSSSQKGIVAEPPDPKLSLSLTSMNSQSQPEDGNWFQQLTNRISQGSKELTEGVKGLLSQRGPAPTQGSGVSATHRGLVDNNRDGLQA